MTKDIAINCVDMDNVKHLIKNGCSRFSTSFESTFIFEMRLTRLLLASFCELNVLVEKILCISSIDKHSLTASKSSYMPR